ncbi:uncharacterized protein DFE_0166 [Desulfovibrio ferrophilus]|uniref:Lipoprotein n=2 Tax=Desulfovibrio ferrophilus TaxID=241368 RepID=A0A2Z6AUH9_9BACT|nr:uncharacterized protein DFE_0166 [Desulfovibrio ferrophilus]
MSLAGCGPKDNRITLTYAPVGQPGGCIGSVGVTSILDARQDKMLGHNQSVAFRPEGREVDQWVQQALMDEFSVRGCLVESLKEGKPRFIIGGEVHAARLVTDGMDHVLDLDVRLTLLEGDRVVLKKSYAGHWEQQIFPASREKSEALFASSLSELLGQAVSEFTTAMSQ